MFALLLLPEETKKISNINKWSFIIVGEESTTCYLVDSIIDVKNIIKETPVIPWFDDFNKITIDLETELEAINILNEYLYNIKKSTIPFGYKPIKPKILNKLFIKTDSKNMIDIKIDKSIIEELNWNIGIKINIAQNIINNDYCIYISNDNGAILKENEENYQTNNFLYIEECQKIYNEWTPIPFFIWENNIYFNFI